MPKVTAETVDYVAKLAYLSLSEEERATFAQQLDEILGYAESIQSLDVESVPAMSHAGTAERFREDAPTESLPRQRAIAAAPDAADNLFRVPRVIAE